MFTMLVYTNQMASQECLRRVWFLPLNQVLFGAWRPDVECPERYANIGIRIEDDVLITKDGPGCFDKGLSKDS